MLEKVLLSSRRLARRAAHFLYFKNIRLRNKIVYLLNGSVYFNPDDDRSKWLIRTTGLTQAGIMGCWRSSVKALSPDFAIDIGANYGEISLSARYPKHCKVFLFEANPKVIKYLQRSVKAHVNKDQIFVKNIAVSNQPGQIEFNVDPINSGSSSVKSFPGSHREPIIVEANSLDNLLGEYAIGKNILFKIDTEGWEGNVLHSMIKTMKSCKNFVGIVEFNRENLERSGFGANKFTDLVTELGEVRYLDKKNRLHALSDHETLPNHTDLILFSSNDIAQKLAISKWIRTR